MTSHLIPPGEKINIKDLETEGKKLHDDRKKAEKECKELREEMIELQNRLYAEGKQSLLVVFQAMDAGGNDGTIRKVFSGVNPQGVRVHSFKAPTKKELAHDYLWRVHKVVPAKGMIGVFNRSHYEDVLVVRVENIVPEPVWQKRYEQINEFEQLLSENGTRILKFFLNISPDEQKSRFQDRLDEPEKNWKFSIDDLAKRKKWDVYMEAYQAVLQNCSTEAGAWYAIPSDQKWYRNLAITKTIVKTLKDMDPQYPDQKDDLSNVVVE